MNIKFGASLLSWITPVWTPEAGKYAIEKTAQAGFDLIEILLPPSMEFNAKEVKQQLKNNQLGVVCSLNLPKEAHIAFYPEAAESLIRQAIDKTSGLETDFLGGVLHGGIGVFSGDPLTDAEAGIITQVWSHIADYAKEKGVNIGIEPINRYETYVCNTAENVLDLISRTGKDNLYLHLDTFHMNIEENNFYDPVVLAGKKLTALKEIDFEGNLVLENFSSSVPGMQQMVSLWQKSPHDADALAKGSLDFMKSRCL